LNINKTFGLKALLIVVLGFVSSVKAIEPFVIKEIQVQGLQRVELGTFFTYLPIKVGEVIDDVRAPMVIRGIFKSGSFSDVELAKKDDILVIVLKERPVISSLTFDGNTAIKTEDLEKGLKSQGLSKGEVLDPGILDKLKQDLEKQYFSFGKYGVKVKYTVNNLPRNRVNIRFVIEEGEAATIAAITIVGNETFTDEEIAEQFELSTGGWLSWFTDDNQYAREKLGGDIEKLRSFYQDRGYLKFSVTSTQVAITPDKKAIYITLNVDEGEKYTVSNISFSGKPIIKEDALKYLVPIIKNDTYSGAVVTFGEENVAKALGRRGYAFANVSTIPTINEEKHTVDLNIFVDPGKRTYIRRISFSGNEKTNDHVLRREMRLMESGALSTDLVDRSKLRLERLAFFEEVNVETVPVVGEDDLVDIVFDVKERPSGSIGGGLGYSDFQGLQLNANIVQNNFLGSGKSVSFNINSSKAIKSASINYTDPYYTPDEISFGAGLFFSQSDYEKLGFAGQSLDRTGFSLNYGVPLSEVSRLNFGILIQDSSLKTAADQGIAVSEQIRQFFESVNQDVLENPTLDFQLLTASVSWLKSTLNRGVFPDRGTSQTLSFSATVPVGDIDYYKLDYKIDHYMPIAQGWSVLMKANLSYGDAYGNNNDKLPYFENFFAGGITTLRGFDSNTIGPKEFFITSSAGVAIPGVDSEDNPISVPLGPEFSNVNLVNRVVGGNARFLGGLELIFPTPFASENRSIRSSIFLDVGNVWDTQFDRSQYSFLQPSKLALIPDFANIDNYRASYGLSIQWLSPMGPLIFSLANPFRKQDQDRIEKFSFNVGKTF
jgi:outer membrane protein insertion porin family